MSRTWTSSVDDRSVGGAASADEATVAAISNAVTVDAAEDRSSFIGRKRMGAMLGNGPEPHKASPFLVSLLPRFEGIGKADICDSRHP